jgi:CDP-diacylglycerol--serine O-phosphatidyltransferase
LGGAVHILPNLLTSGNLFFGFFSIIKSMQGDFTWAAGAILLSAIFDILDGRVARMTNATSEFGVQYDSLCDLVSFGVAPAMMMHQFALSGLGRFGWVLCFVFLACGALRLARFNVQSALGKASGDFTGLPIPMAAGVVACFVALMTEIDQSGPSDSWLLADFLALLASQGFRKGFLLLLAPSLAFLMVSNVLYRSHKSANIKGVKPFRLLAILVAVVGMAAYQPALLGFLFFFLYALTGPLEFVLGWKKATDDDEIFEVDDEENSLDEYPEVDHHDEGQIK